VDVIGNSVYHLEDAAVLPLGGSLGGLLARVGKGRSASAVWCCRDLAETRGRCTIQRPNWGSSGEGRGTPLRRLHLCQQPKVGRRQRGERQGLYALVELEAPVPRIDDPDAFEREIIEAMALPRRPPGSASRRSSVGPAAAVGRSCRPGYHENL